MKQWREQQRQEDDESDQQPSVKIPKLFLETTSTTASTGVVGSAALPLFVSDHHHHHHHHHHQDQDTNQLTHLSPFLSDSSSKFPRMGSNGYFSVAQWQELELQALIYRYMLAGADVPPELLLPIKKSLLHSAPPYFLHYSQCQPAALLQSGYWGRAAMDPEPGRCRRTDGKKWRCSRDVVAGHKYCERHMHRGRNRSRKPVEIPTPSTATTTSNGVINGGAGAGTLKTNITATGGSTLAGVPTGRSSNFGIPGPAPSMDLLHFNRRIGNNGLFESHQSEVKNHNSNSNKSDGHILRPFFDDWPRTMQESSNAESNLSRMNSTTSLSISMPGNPPSDVSLKLSTGANAEEPGPRGREREVLQPNWAMGWASNNVTSMGGPLAEALRSSASNSSPTSVLHQLQRNSVSETSYVST